ncbi:hypothetical protein CR513_25818, partial [Mucuna pruriens]
MSLFSKIKNYIGKNYEFQIDKTTISKVKIRNREHIEVKGIVIIDSQSYMKLIYNNLYLLEQSYKMLLEYKNCVIRDLNNIEVFKVQMK